jgi:germination protein M
MRAVVVLLLGTLVAVGAGCTDDEPETPSAVAIYLVRDGRVATVRRTVAAPTGSPAADAVEALAAGPTDEERAEGYTTELPATMPVELADGSATVDAEVSPLGAAQLVNTLSQFPDVARIVIDGETVTRKDVEEATPQIVIESPLDGDVVSSPIRLRGTANVFEATVSIEVKDATGTVVLEAFTTATSGSGTRGTFDTELVLPEASGTMTIVAFESSAKDGTPLHETDVQVTVEP